MKIFPAQQHSAPEKPKKSSGVKGDVKGERTGISRKKAALPERKDMSAADIKEKLAAHVQTSSASKNTAIKNSQKLGEGFLNHDLVAAPVIVPIDKSPEGIAATKVESDAQIEKAKKDHLLRSDIAANDPSDSNTQEKLKTVLTRGAFSFSAREKEVLEKILA